MRGGDIIKNKAVIPVCLSAFFMNFILFALKLYIGLSVNSISIYSDGVNNLFDSLSGLLSVICLWAVCRNADSSTKSRTAKIEQLLSFILSVIVGVSGFIFVYSSLERLMYPTPVWFLVKFFWLLVATAFIKFLMFIYFRYKWKKLDSEVLKVMSFDSLLDFFITTVTVITFVVSKSGTYSIDAVCGVFISIVIIISAVKMIISSGKNLMNFTAKENRLLIEELLSEYGIDSEKSELVFSLSENKEVYLKTDTELNAENLEELKKQVFEQTGIEFYIAK